MKKALFLLSFIVALLLIIKLQIVNAEDNRCTDAAVVQSMNEQEAAQCEAKLKEALKSLIKATAPSLAQLNNLKAQLKAIEQRVVFIENDVAKKKKIIAQAYEDLAKQKEIFDRTVRGSYIKSYAFSPILVFVSATDAADITRILAYQKRDADQDKAIITNIAVKINEVVIAQEQLEEEEARLAKTKDMLATEKVSIEKLVQGSQAYQATLSSQIAVLSARQQQILAQKLGGLNLPQSLGAGPLICTDDRKLNPGFGNAFAFFTFGIPHRVGMNQYGAWGRAKAGQSEEQILQAYFQNFEFQNGRENENVVVNGTNEFNQTFNNESMNIEEYLKHLHEMPTSWTDNNSAALKAQAVAARSYALRVYADKLSDSDPNNNFLRPSQADQVIKREINNSNWIDAVTATNGKVMVAEGKPIKAWFASTSGGYTFTSQDVWGGTTSWTKRLRDTNGDVGSFGDIQNKSYDKDSKCLYAAQGWRNEYDKSAWLKGSEVADIANVILLARQDSGTKEHLYQPDKPPSGTDNWNQERVTQELRNRNITPFERVESISISADFGSGITNSIVISGNRSESFSGSEFKDWFNLRAPANIQIVGPLFNVETK